MKQLTSDARNFVNGIVDHLKQDKKGGEANPKIASLLRKVSDDAKKDHTARVLTAVPLSLSEKQDLSKALSVRIGHPVTLVCEVQKNIIGGIRIEIADVIIDTGYKEKLKNIESVLLKGSHI